MVQVIRLAALSAALAASLVSIVEDGRARQRVGATTSAGAGLRAGG